MSQVIENHKVLAIIPARGGSKGIPNKNIVMLNENPLIYYSITSALKSRYIDILIVSTDDSQIADIAKSFGASVPFIRPVQFAKDDTPDFPVFLHAIQEMEKLDFFPNLVLNLRPTAPFRSTTTIDKALELFVEKTPDSIRSMSKVKKHPYWMYKINNLGVHPFIEGKSMKEYPRRQLLPELYYLDGVIDIMRRDIIIREKNLYGEKIVAYLTPEIESIDIDDMNDLNYARYLLNEDIIVKSLWF